MRRFFKGRSFKVMIIVVAVVISISITVGVIKTQAPQSSVIGTILKPIQQFSACVKVKVDDFFNTFTEYDQLKKENEELKEQIKALEDEKIQWQSALNENEFYRQFYDVKEDNPDYEFLSAKVIARDTVDIYGCLTLNKGSLDGVSVKDVVITSEGLVGSVTNVSPTYSVITTILSPDLRVGVTDSRTGDTGIVSGDLNSAIKNMSVMKGIPKSSQIAEGDFVITSGGSGIFPKGITVGTVKSIGQQNNENTLSVCIEPAADIFNCSDVMIITSFTGQNQ
ncbi:MAG: rod shape-determining protein MreC [Acutalibacteraceae bacterium]|nr:rod shape-determining protein MreC [Acutalibacteraceae bacterium]